ncbi:MAG: iron-containing alcohol dehydrogenase [Treponema sp.]|jgi:alcohol dehydrogenase class IV|nr:iron-containing alcohol dehydrogenase [Treponema sp.]
MKINYLMPTRILMGENCVFEQRVLISQLGKKALVITGKNSARASGAYDDTVKALEANGQEHVLYDQVMANPTDICVSEAGKLAGTSRCDFVLAIGGGSPMDAAKAAAILAINDISKEEMFRLSFSKALPLAVIPTTAGTGSETTPYSVLVDTTEEDGRTPRKSGPVKRSVNSPLIFPGFAFLDAKYMLDLNRNITVNTAIDALSHAMEGMLSIRSDYLSDTLARESIAMIMDCLEDLLSFPTNPSSFAGEKREKLLLASTIAGMVIAQTGTTAPHSMGYEFTLNWNTDHGRANGLLMKSFLLWCREKEQALYKTDSSFKPRIPRLCTVLGMDLEAFLDRVEELLGQREKAGEAEITAWSVKPMKNAANTYIVPNQQEIERIYRESVG